MTEKLAHLFRLGGLMLLIAVGLIDELSAEVLRILERHDIGRQFDFGCVLCIGDDSLLFVTDSGLYQLDKRTNSYQMLMARFPREEQVPFSFCDNGRLTRLVTPAGMWQYDAKDGKEILIHEQFCGRLYQLRQSGDGTSYLTTSDRRKGGDAFYETIVQGSTILSALLGNDTKERVVVQSINGGDYRRLFKCSDALIRWRDSVGLSHTPFCKPSLNPHDSTLWLAVQGYTHIYITDMEGNLRDSVPIGRADYRQPPRQRSRIKSDAVAMDWFSQWTYITSFAYASPGYFIMQYNTGTDTCAAYKRNKFTTIIWNTNKRVVPITIDPLWRLAGVQDDGRIIFVAPEADSSGCKETIIVTRIEP